MNMSESYMHCINTDLHTKSADENSPNQKHDVNLSFLKNKSMYLWKVLNDLHFHLQERRTATKRWDECIAGFVFSWDLLTKRSFIPLVTQVC